MPFIITHTLFENMDDFPKPDVTFAQKRIALQNFSFRHPLINYIKKNPVTPKSYINLLKSCKYFYSKKDLIIPLNAASRSTISDIFSFNQGQTKYKCPFKVWLSDSLSLRHPLQNQDYADIYFIKKAIRCNLKKLELRGQTISFETFKFLTVNGLVEFHCYHTNIMNKDGTVVPIETIFSNLKNIVVIDYTITLETAKLVTDKTTVKLIGAVAESKFKKCCIQWMPLSFDFEMFERFTDATMPFTITFNRFKNMDDIPKPVNTFDPKNVVFQNFSFRHPLINYIKKNPATPKSYINLLKSCKYFYSKKDIIIPLNDCSRYYIWEIISSKKDPTKYKLPFKVWITTSFNLSPISPESMKKNLYFFKNATRCSLKKLTIWSQNITLKEFLFLTQNGLEQFDCRCTSIMSNEDTVVPVETILEYLRNLKDIHYTFGKETAKLVTKETAKNLIEIIDTSKLKTFCFDWIPSTFDFETFKKFTDAHPDISFDVEVI